MAGARKRIRPGRRCYEGWYFNRFGRVCWFKGFPSRRLTLKAAHAQEDKEREILLGIRKPLQDDAPMAGVIRAYIEWGSSSGGRKREGWSPIHRRQRERHLEFWQDQLRVMRVGDLMGCLSLAEHTLRQLEKKGAAPKTVWSHAQSLKAFCRWCVERDFLDADPVRHLKAGSKRAQRKRRTFSEEEIQAVLDVAPRYRRVVYIVALFTGFRAEELRALRARDFDREAALLTLSEGLTKNGKAATQPVPRQFLNELREWCIGRKPADPLLDVPSHTARELDRDLNAAGIEKWKDGEALDFHSLRVTFATWLAEAGAHPGEVQELMRHAAPDLTFGTYTRSGAERRRASVEAIAGSVFGGGLATERKAQA